MFKDIQASLEDRKVLLDNALKAIRAWTPEDDPQANAKARSASFIAGELAETVRDIDGYRIAQLCIDGMQPTTTPAGPASPVPAYEPEPGGDDG